jgi:hypothetical protein
MAFSLPRIPPDLISPEFQVWWQQVVEQIEAQETSQNDLITGLANAQADIVDAQNRLAIGLSWTVPSKVMTASDAGSSASIAIASHTRIYANGLQNALPAATLTGLAYSTAYGVYYDPTSLGDSSPVYHATTDLKTAQHNYVPLRVMVGVIETPAAASPPVISGNIPPGSYSGPGSYNYGAIP